MLKKVALRNKIVRSAFENALADYGRVYLHFAVAGKDITLASLTHWPDESSVRKGLLAPFRTNSPSKSSATEDALIDALTLHIDRDGGMELETTEGGVSFKTSFGGVVSSVSVPWNAVFGLHVLSDSQTGFPADYTFGDAPYANAANTAPASFLTGTGSNVVAFKPRPKK